MTPQQAAEAMREVCARKCEVTAVTAKRLGQYTAEGTLKNAAVAIRAIDIEEVLK